MTDQVVLGSEPRCTVGSRLFRVQTTMASHARPRLAALASAVIALLLATAACAAPGGDPAASALDDDTTMGPVTLLVSDVDRVQAYYQDGIGLAVLTESDGAVALGLGDRELIRLETSTDQPRRPAEAGLYHSAIRYPDPAALADALDRLPEEVVLSYQGASDHRVSLAFYFADPEGNGVELYVDRPREEWVWEDGQIVMGSAPLDPGAFIAEHATGMAPTAADMGHVHLQVGDIAEAEEFYVDALGFAVTSRTEDGSALFMAVGGYHHHLAVNTWHSAGAGQRSTTTGLATFTVVLPTAAELTAATDRLEAAGHAVEAGEGTVTVRDPWGTVVTLAVAD